MENNLFDENVEVNAEVETQAETYADVTAEAPAEEKPTGFKAILAKIAAIPKAVWIALAGVVVAVIAGIFIFDLVTNTPEAPVKAMVEQSNTKKISNYGDYMVKSLNGFAKDEVMKIYNIRMKSEDFEDRINENIDSYDEYVEDMKDEYGDNYKYSYKVEEKEELEKEDLRDFKDQIKKYAETLKEAIDRTDDFDSDDWEEFAEHYDLSKSEAKDLVKAWEALRNELKDIKVTEGYELTVTVTLDGSELDEPEEEEETVRVYKVNGRWISSQAISVIMGIFY